MKDKQPYPEKQAPKGPPQKAAPAAPRNTDPNFNHLVRLGSADLDGNKQIMYALRGIRGVSYSLANALCLLAGVDRAKKAGYLKEAEVQKIEGVLKDPMRNGIPEWMVNHRRDFETNETKHLIAGDLQFVVETDIRRMKKNKTYKGLRHQWGQPVRGQRTKSNFRKNKGKGMGVKKKTGAKEGRT